MLYTNNHKERMDNAIESLSTKQKWELLDKLESQDYDFMNYENENDYGTTAIEVLVNAMLEVTSFIAKKLGIVGK